VNTSRLAASAEDAMDSMLGAYSDARDCEALAALVKSEELHARLRRLRFAIAATAGKLGLYLEALKKELPAGALPLPMEDAGLDMLSLAVVAGSKKKTRSTSKAGTAVKAAKDEQPKGADWFASHGFSKRMAAANDHSLEGGD
jgi:hypothetical protein